MKLILALLFAPLLASAQDKTVELALPPHMLQICVAQGGCMLITLRQYELDLAKVEFESFMKGIVRGAEACVPPKVTPPPPKKEPML